VTDEEVPSVVATPGTGVEGYRVWTSAPSDVSDWVNKISLDDVASVQPSPGASWCVLFVFPPSDEFRVLGGVLETSDDAIDTKGFHVTRTIDYIFIVDGEVVLDLEDESVTVSQGDVVVQRATRHAWRTQKGVQMLSVVIDA
jgi:mannose-6-phosphate isomerase-like protein (cupin superfamily)